MHLKKKSITVCFSCYNETKYVIKNIKKVRPLLKKQNLKFELMVVDDASSENDIKKLKKFCIKNKIIYIRHTHNLGFFKSFLSGLIKSKCQYFKLFAGDDATNTNHIRLMFKEFYKQDLLIPYNNQFEMNGKPFSRKIISIIYTKIINLLSGLNLKYYNGLPVFLKRKALMNLSDTSGYGWQAELIVNCIYSGCRYKEIYTKNREIKFVYDSIKLRNVFSVIFSIIRVFF
ncbi:glycosyltransferase [Candidatus Pelagibacter ubique]|nr:glycosyltransferase [Candidatus Pelagibacter ubique]